MKKILIILGLLSILTTTTFASAFTSISYGQGLEDRILIHNGNEVIFKNYQSVRFKLGAQFFPIEESKHTFGTYLDIGYGFSDKYIENDNEEEFRSQSLMLTIGSTFALNNYFVLFGGLGPEFRMLPQELENETNLNFNGGLLMYFYESRMGLIMEYDSAPNTVSAGLVLRY